MQRERALAGPSKREGKRKKDGRQIVREGANSGKPERLIENWSKKGLEKWEKRAGKRKPAE